MGNPRIGSTLDTAHLAATGEVRPLPYGRARAIYLTIAPATATTCGDGDGAFCPLAGTSNFGVRFSCALWGTLEDKDGRLQRRAECLVAEAEHDGLQTLRARVEQAEAERDELRALLDAMRDAYRPASADELDAARMDAAVARAERDAARAELRETFAGVE